MSPGVNKATDDFLPKGDGKNVQAGLPWWLVGDARWLGQRIYSGVLQSAAIALIALRQTWSKEGGRWSLGGIGQQTEYLSLNCQRS